jgi:hypothetical protein
MKLSTTASARHCAQEWCGVRLYRREIVGSYAVGVPGPIAGAGLSGLILADFSPGGDGGRKPSEHAMSLRAKKLTEALAISIPRTEAAVIRHFLRIARQMLVNLFHDRFSSAKASRKQRWNCLRVTCHFFRSASSSNHIMHSKPS